MRIFDGLDKTEYQDVLRVLGYVADVESLRYLRIIECEDGVLLQGLPFPGAGNQGVVSKYYSDDSLRDLLEDAYRRRIRQGGGGALPASVGTLLLPAEPELSGAPMPMPSGVVRVQPGWAALQMTLRNLGDAAAHGIELLAQWKQVVLYGFLAHLDSEGETAVVLAQADPAAVGSVDGSDDLGLRLRIRYQTDNNQPLELRCFYRRAEDGWRLNRLPGPRPQSATPELAADADSSEAPVDFPGRPQRSPRTVMRRLITR